MLAPPGVVAIRLCRYSGLGSPGFAWKLVRSRRFTNHVLITELVGEFDALKSPPPGAAFACPNGDGSLIVALLAYEGGEHVRIKVDRTGCQGVTNGDVASLADGYGTAVGPKLERQLNALTAAR